MPLFPLPSQLLLIIDRTNWKLGKTHLNLLVLSIVYQGIAIPIYWVSLDKAGTSHTDERIYSVVKSIYRIGKHRIAGILADREFIGSQWFAWLKSNNINFTIRIKQNMLVGRFIDDQRPTPVHSLFRQLKNERRKYLKQQFYLGGVPVYLAASKAPNGQLLIVATSRYNRLALKNYKRRWEIETLFGCWKSKGFRLEDTRMTDKHKIENLVSVLVIAFCWVYLVGIKQASNKPLPTKSHGRKSQSLFRYGYDILRQAVLRGLVFFRRYFSFLLADPGGYAHV